jgi:hypothetical protein
MLTCSAPAAPEAPAAPTCSPLPQLPQLRAGPMRNGVIFNISAADDGQSAAMLAAAVWVAYARVSSRADARVSSSCVGQYMLASALYARVSCSSCPRPHSTLWCCS